MHSRFPFGPIPKRLHQNLLNLTANTKGAGVHEAERQEITNTFTGEVIGSVLLGTGDDVTRAFDLARAAQQCWAETPFSQRQEIFRDFHDRVYKHRELMMDIVQMETGKNRLSALDEVLDVLSNARYYANKLPDLMSEKKRPGALPGFTRTVQQQVPKGVVGQITPWNYPLALGVSDAIAALLAGNGVVAKPDSSTPFSMLIAVLFLYESGLPRDLFQVVTGSGRTVGSAIADHCDYLMFTGSTATGKILGRQVGERLVGYSAELGGKNPLIVTNDANLDVVERELPSACFSNSGQLCVSIERIYVEEGVYDEVVRRFQRAVSKMKIGAGDAWDIDMGSLINETQFNTVTKFVDEARAAGAKVLCGGKPRPDLGPYFYEPTVLVDVPEGTPVLTEEVFGPVVFIQKVSSTEEAIKKANDTSYGLNASVFAESGTGRKVATRLLAGGVGINDGYAATWASVAVPLGGMKQSGMARRHGPEGLLKYTETRNVAEQRLLSMRGPKNTPRKLYANLMANAMWMGKKLRFLP